MAGGSARIKAAVREAAARQEEWPARVAAGIHGALEFAAREPGALGDGDCSVLIHHFTERLRENAPPERHQPRAGGQEPVRTIARIVDAHVRLERAERLLEVAPDVVQLALLPYLGFDEAKRWAEQTSRPRRDRTGSKGT